MKTIKTTIDNVNNFASKENYIGYYIDFSKFIPVAVVMLKA